jgi:hypothetical protein
MDLEAIRFPEALCGERITTLKGVMFRRKRDLLFEQKLGHVLRAPAQVRTNVATRQT